VKVSALTTDATVPRADDGTVAWALVHAATAADAVSRWERPHDSLRRLVNAGALRRGLGAPLTAVA
jgi:hypothetical protein